MTIILYFVFIFLLVFLGIGTCFLLRGFYDRFNQPSYKVIPVKKSNSGTLNIDVLYFFIGTILFAVIVNSLAIASQMDDAFNFDFKIGLALAFSFCFPMGLMYYFQDFLLRGWIATLSSILSYLLYPIIVIVSARIKNRYLVRFFYFILVLLLVLNIIGCYKLDPINSVLNGLE